jgi:SRSO17 transposase
LDERTYVERIVFRLGSFMEEFSSFFKTKTHHGAGFARQYIAGLMQGKRDAKNIERMAESVEGLNYQGVQQFIASSPWDHRPLMDAVAQGANGLVGNSPHSFLIIDDSCYEKKGHESVGVARQYNGRLGKVDNCQTAVCSSLADGVHSTLVDMRLYLPQAWCEDSKRCDKAGVPQDQRQMLSKTQLALQSIAHCRALGLGFKGISMDSGYGSQPEFLAALDQSGEIFVAEVHCNQHVWQDCPWPHRQAKRPGAKLKHPIPSTPSQEVEKWAQAQRDAQWERLKVRESDQGWIEVRYLAQRVWTLHEGRECARWLLVWENPDEAFQKRRRHFALSNAPKTVDVRRLIAQGVQREAIERNFRDSKKELGMADYQVRGWTAWHHHMSLVMLAMLFVAREKVHHPTSKDQAALSAGDIVFIVEHYLPHRAYGAPQKAAVVDMLIQRRRQRQIDQQRRRLRTAQQRPPLWPGEDLTTD